MQLSKILKSLFLTTTLALPACAIYQKLNTPAEQNNSNDELTEIVNQAYNSESSSRIQQAITEIIPPINNANPDTITLNKTEPQFIQPINLSINPNAEFLQQRTNQTQNTTSLNIDHTQLQQISLGYEHVSFDQDLQDMMYSESLPPRIQDETKLSLFDASGIMERFQTHLENNAEQIAYRNLHNSRMRELSGIRDRQDYNSRVRGGYPKGNEFGDYLEQEFMLELYKETRRLVTRSITDTVRDLDAYDLIRPFFRFNLKKDAPVISDVLQTTIPQEQNPTWADHLLDRMSEVSVGITFDINLLKSRELNLQPYIEWMNIIRLTYSSQNKTIQHRIALRIDKFSIGTILETDQAMRRINNAEFNITYNINENSAISLNGSKTFHDSEENSEQKESEIYISYVLRF